MMAVATSSEKIGIPVFGTATMFLIDISSVITAYVRSSALVLCGKDVAIPFFVSWEFESNRMRKIVKKLGGTQLAYA